MKIIVDKDIPYIKGRLEEFSKVEYYQGEKINADIVKNADALIIRTRTRCNADLLRNSDIKIISTATIGMDHIDIPWCESNGIKVCSAPGCNAPGVAQYVFSSLLINGFNPQNDTLGIVGYGNVGSTVGEWAKEMGIKIKVYDPPRHEKGFNDIDYYNLEDVLQQSDAVTLHVPLTYVGKYPTYHLIGEDELKKIKRNGIIINSSRGGVVDETALKNILRLKKIKAIVDVWENEPFIDKELLELTEISTPHIAGYSYEGKIRGTRMALTSVASYLGINPNLEGLECSNPPKNLKITPELILNSYTPLIDSNNLKNRIDKFEDLRNHYNYRHEPLFQ